MGPSRPRVAFRCGASTDGLEEAGHGLCNPGAIRRRCPPDLGRRRRDGHLEMALTRQDVRDVVDTYIRAWVEQDPDLIVTIFTDTATYHEKVFEAPIQNREGIRAYWEEKVVESQAHITCELLDLYLDGNTAIVEWEAQFDDLPERVRKRMREVAILVFEGKLIASLREYWSSEPIANLCPEDQQPNPGGRAVEDLEAS